MLDELQVYTIVARQKAIYEELYKLKTNIAKDGADRKTTAYKEKKLQVLEDLWTEFHANHESIKPYVKADTPYMQSNTHDKVKKIYEDTKQTLQSIVPENKETGTTPKTAVHPGLPPIGNIGEATGNLQSNAAEENKGAGAIPKVIIQKQYSPQGNASELSDLVRVTRRQKTTIQSLQRLLISINTTAEDAWSSTFCSVKLNALQRYWMEAEENHRLIHELSENPGRDGYNLDEFYQLEDDVQESMISLTTRSDQISTRNSPSFNPAMSLPSTHNQTLKLPKVTLPKFDGDYIKWKQFSDLFTELVHKQNIANCQKLFYLKTTLTGEAENLIRHFTTSDDNYSAAWQVVKDRYDNPRLLVTAHVQKLLMQPAIQSEGSKAIKVLHDTTQECMLSLKGLNIDTTNWDPLLMCVLIKKLDRNTLTLWEQSLKQPKALPSLNEFMTFLETRFQSLEALGTNSRKFSEDQRQRSRPDKAYTTLVTTGSTCISCKGNHQLYACDKFLKLSPSQRLNLVQRSKHCTNCLRSGHVTNDCSFGSCAKCQKKHNTLLHLDESTRSKNRKAPASTGTTVPSADSASLCTSAAGTSPSVMMSTSVILGTAIVNIRCQTGRQIACRALLDSGSQVNLITEKLAKSLGLKETQEALCVEGIGQSRQASHRRINIEINSKINGFSTRVEAHILQKIISPQPSRPIIKSSWNIPNNIVLADSQFDRPGPIDLLIGAEIFYSTLVVGQISLGDDRPTLQNTVFGWTVVGKASTPANSSMVAACGICTADAAMDQQIERLWRIEEIYCATTDNFTQAEKRCETHFTQTTTRDSTGRFVVRLPFKEAPTCLGESKDIAFKRFIALERRLANSPELKKLYRQFMEEYQQLGHMQEVVLHQIAKPYYFLPHHCIQKPDSSTTKLRVVFDASAKTSTNLSLNDILSTGPTIQDDVFSMLLRFRMPRYVFTADIEKMYRQVLLNEEDQKFQLIWWRSSPNDALKCFKLQTVTYGTTSASYLATKCLQTLAQENKERFPLGSMALLRDFYVDDVLTGSNKIAELLTAQSELQTILQKSGFKLRKWCANHASLLKGIPLEDRETELDFSSNIDEHIKTIGLTWLPKADQLCVKTSWAGKVRVTKRSAYSDIAHLFDPLGVMAPVVVVAKIFLQKLWELKLDWDAALPQEMQTTWLKYREGLQSLNNIKIDRHIFSHRNPKNTQYHVFADASEKAYGAAVYVRSVSNDNIITVRLLCSKSRVAPSKQTRLAQQATIPRLELCAACLATELLLRLQKDLQIHNDATFLWTDSEIVLAWINSSSSASLPVFVANRVARIQQNTIPQQWHHVPSKENPADVLSRGIAPERLQDCNIWFYGPKFLHGATSIWPPNYKPIIENQSVGAAVHDSPPHQEGILTTINHKNSFKFAERIAAFTLRFIHNMRQKVLITKIKKNKEELSAEEVELKLAQIKLTNGPLSVVELSQSKKKIFKLMQQDEFQSEIKHLKDEGEVPNKSPYKSLTPFLDEEGLIRVGGRLEASSLSYDAKHPILIPYNHLYTKMIFTEIHEDNNHVGPQTMLSIARQNIWPVKGKTLARSVLHKCTECARAAPKLLSQQMGNLPANRTQPARPFINTGVDFCGPISTHYKIRGKRPQKSYIAIFCCFSTKACHLELVTDLTAQGFIGALKRFMARRGHSRNIYCDNATNFVGAKNQLSILMAFMESETEREKITSTCATEGCDFHFIPPRSPHFGGLWEAAVKSSKHLLQHTLAGASLTYEELETAATQVEAILNSRPITPMSDSPNDLTALTPGHFLIGEPLLNNVDPSAASNDSGMLARWNLVNHLKNEFWRRWSRDYLNQLQHRYKWKERCQNAEPGMMVIIKEDNTPSLRWPLGRITNVITGDDGLVRVADVQTATGMFRRAIHRLAPLPVPNQNNDVHPNKRTNDPSSHCSSALTHSHQMPENDPVPKKKFKPSIGSATLTILLIVLFAPMIACAPIKMQPFLSQPGIYFENFGTAAMTSSNWNIIAYYDMEPYWTEYNSIATYSRKLSEICQLLPNKNETCKKTLLQFDRLKSDINKDNDLLTITAITPRVRRGALNFIGNVANALFGVLDDEYANHMSATINVLKQDEAHIVTLIRNQTSIIDATINIIKANEQETSSRFEEIDENFKQFADVINNIRQQYHQERLRQLFNSIALQLILVSSQFQKTQAALIDVMTDTHHGRINPQLISPTQLKQEFTRIRANLPPSVRLPVSSVDIAKLYHLMSIHGKALKNHIIFKIELPLLSLDEFELFKVTPVPVLVGTSFFTIQPSTEYLMINLHRDQYYPLSTIEFHGCFSLTEERHLCHLQRPIYRRGSEVSSCEINFLNHAQQSPACKVVSANDGPYWIQLHQPNEWIYVLRVKTTLNVVCNNTVTQSVLEGSGILSIQPGCVIKDDFVTLRGHFTQRTVSRMSLSPAANLSEYVIPDNLTKVSHGTLTYKKHLEELDALKHELLNITKELPSITYQNDVHQFTVSYVALITALTILICLLRWSYCHYCKRNTVISKDERNPSKTSADIRGCIESNKEDPNDKNPSNITFEMIP